MMAELQPDFSDSLQKLEKELECTECTELYSEPKVLHCFHMFCKECLVQHVVQDRQGQLSVRCPNCRGSTLLPAASVSGLQPAFYIHHLLKTQQIYVKLDKSSTSTCDKCKSRATTSEFCVTCNQLICDRCFDVHKHWKELSNHHVVSLKDIKEDFSCLMSHKHMVTSCLYHPHMTLKVYCETCKELVCNKCVMLKHKDHKYKSVNKAAFELCRKEVSTIQKSLHQKIQSVDRATKRLATQQCTISDQRTAVEKDIEDQFAEMHRALNEKKEKLLTQLNLITHGRLEAVQLQEKEMDTFRKCIERCLEFLKKNLKLATEVEIMNTKEHLVEQTSKILDHTIDSIATEHMSIEFNIPDLVSQIGELQTTVETNTQSIPLSDEAENEEQDSVEYTIPSSSDGEDDYVSTDEETTDEHESGGSAATDDTESEPSLDSEGESRVVVRNVTSNKVCFNIREPRGIALNSNGGLIVTSERDNCVRVVTPSGQSVRTIASCDLQMFNLPNGVATDQDSNILIVDTCNHRIQRFTPQWEPSGIVGEAGTKSLQFSNPYGIGFNPVNNKIYVCDNCNHRIQILHSNLSFHRSFGSEGKEAGQFKHPWAVAFDNKGSTYVVDSNNHRIQVFNSEGEFIREFGIEGKEKGKLNLPSGIAIDSEDVVYVCEFSNNRVSVFTSDGVFQRVIGYKGSGPNQLRKPRGVAIDKEGHLYICDYGNNRIQVFNTT